jgi:hypothetical protein
MDSRQILLIVTIVTALSAAMIATPVTAQNITGGNMTGGNVTEGNSTGSISSVDDSMKGEKGEKFCTTPC